MEQAIAELREWPDLALLHASDDEVVYAAGDTPVVRLTSDGFAALHLTRTVIERIGGSLHESGVLTSPADEDWATMRVNTASDFDLLLALVSLAIRANA